MAYTTAEINQAVSLLTQQIKGLTPAAAKVWVTAEQGVNNNVLGVTDSSGHLYIYSTLAQGAQAAANLFNRSSHYVTARAAVAATSDPIAQLRAIAASPWNGGHYAGSTAFQQALGSSTPAATTTPAAAAVVGSGSSGGGTLGATASAKTVADLFSGVTPTHLLTAADIEQILGELTVTGPDDPIIASQRAYYTRYIGKPINQIPLSGESHFGGQLLGVDPGAIAAGLFGNFGWVPGFAVNAAILGTILALGYKGIEEILG